MQNPKMHLTDSLPLDESGLNTVCLRATAAAHSAKEYYRWADKQTPGAWGTRHVLRLAEVHHMKAEALCALLGRKS